MKGGTSLSKRFVKCWARRLVAVGERSLQVLLPGRVRDGLRILTYHRIADDSQDPFAVRPEGFRQQMEMLSASGSVVSLEAAIDGIGASPGCPHRVVLTFDDGTSDFLTVGHPILHRLGLPAALFVSPLKVGTRGFLDWADLRGLSKAGILIGSHGLDHQSLGRLGRAEVQHQVSRSRRMIEDRIGVQVTSLAYPFGTVRDFNPWVKEEIRRAGYRSACTSINGINGCGTDMLELRRTKIEQRDEPIFEWMLRGCLDGWSLIDRHFSFLQNRYP